MDRGGGLTVIHDSHTVLEAALVGAQLVQKGSPQELPSVGIPFAITRSSKKKVPSVVVPFAITRKSEEPGFAQLCKPFVRHVAVATFYHHNSCLRFGVAICEDADREKRRHALWHLPSLLLASRLAPLFVALLIAPCLYLLIASLLASLRALLAKISFS
jgi:hypothetical protein